MYTRVAPRDLFNESKLLKCLGKVAVEIHNETLKGLTFEQSGDPFEIDQDDSSGNLYVADGIQFMVGDRIVRLSTPYNSKDPWPLLAEDDYGNEAFVFTDEGEFREEFLKFIARLPKRGKNELSDEAKEYCKAVWLERDCPRTRIHRHRLLRRRIQRRTRRCSGR